MEYLDSTHDVWKNYTENKIERIAEFHFHRYLDEEVFKEQLKKIFTLSETELEEIIERVIERLFAGE